MDSALDDQDDMPSDSSPSTTSISSDTGSIAGSDDDQQYDIRDYTPPRQEARFTVRDLEELVEYINLRTGSQVFIELL